MSIYFEPNSLFFLLCIPRRNGFSHHHWLLCVSPEFTLLREVSQVSLSNIMMFHLMLDLARRCRLGIRAWICSVQKCCRQHPACLKCPLTFHSRGNPCLCSLCVLHVSYLMHFFPPGRLPSACQTCTAAWNSVFNDWICFNSSPLVVLVFILFSHSVILTFLVHGQLVFLYPRSRLFCLSIDARPPPGPVLLTQLPDKAAAANSVEKLSSCPGCEHLMPPPCDFNQPTFVYLFIFCWIANSYILKNTYMHIIVLILNLFSASLRGFLVLTSLIGSAWLDKSSVTSRVE